MTVETESSGLDWGKIGTNVLTSGLTGGITGIIGGLFSKKQKVPAPMTAEQMKERMDHLYPGTSSYERLAKGGGGVPQASASQDQARIAGEMQRQQHKNAMQITRANNATAVRQAEINKDALLQKTMMEQNTGYLAQAQVFKAVEDGTLSMKQAQILEEKAPHEIKLLEASLDKHVKEIEQIGQDIKTAKSQEERNIAEAKLKDKQASIVLPEHIRGWADTIIRGGSLLRIPKIVEMLKGSGKKGSTGLTNPFENITEIFNPRPK